MPTMSSTPRPWPGTQTTSGAGALALVGSSTYARPLTPGRLSNTIFSRRYPGNARVSSVAGRSGPRSVGKPPTRSVSFADSARCHSSASRRVRAWKRRRRGAAAYRSRVKTTGSKRRSSMPRVIPVSGPVYADGCAGWLEPAESAADATAPIAGAAASIRASSRRVMFLAIIGADYRPPFVPLQWKRRYHDFAFRAGGGWRDQAHLYGRAGLCVRARGRAFPRSRSRRSGAGTAHLLREGHPSDLSGVVRELSWRAAGLGFRPAHVRVGAERRRPRRRHRTGERRSEPPVPPHRGTRAAVDAEGGRRPQRTADFADQCVDRSGRALG